MTLNLNLFPYFIVLWEREICSANQRPPSLCPYCSFKNFHPQQIFLFLFSLPASYKEPFKPLHDTQSSHSYLGSANEGARERASLWKLGNSRTLVLNRRPPFLITEVRSSAFPTLSSLLLLEALTLRLGLSYRILEKKPDSELHI